MTLRMEHDDHLKLRLYAAHSRNSCQEIISEALNHYLNQSEKVCDLSNCKCLSR
jgi:predicted HicB family RNase H-like nuclease